MSLRRSPSSVLAFAGIATLVGGTLAAIAPNCLTSPDMCTILLSRNTPAGTLGFLTAPVANRGPTDTTFTITSTSATETSTVNWIAIPKDVGLANSTTFVNNASLRRGPSGLQVHRGRATLIGGTVTVTGVNLSSNSKIFCMAADIAGTSGKLSTPSASVDPTTGQFVINSNSGTDTSTVDWVVIGQSLRFSPSGQVFAQSKGTLASSTQFTGMNPLNDALISVIASVITSATPGNLSSPVSSRVGGRVDILSSVGGDGSLVELAVF